jgi:hypothetical protein
MRSLQVSDIHTILLLPTPTSHTRANIAPQYGECMGGRSLSVRVCLEKVAQLLASLSTTEHQLHAWLFCMPTNSHLSSFLGSLTSWITSSPTGLGGPGGPSSPTGPSPGNGWLANHKGQLIPAKQPGTFGCDTIHLISSYCFILQLVGVKALRPRSAAKITVEFTKPSVMVQYSTNNGLELLLANWAYLLSLYLICGQC